MNIQGIQASILVEKKKEKKEKNQRDTFIQIDIFFDHSVRG